MLIKVFGIWLMTFNIAGLADYRGGWRNNNIKGCEIRFQTPLYQLDNSERSIFSSGMGAVVKGRTCAQVAEEINNQIIKAERRQIVM